MLEGGVGISLILSMLPDEERARLIAGQLVDERLIACGSIMPGVTSIYRWQGIVEEAGEVMLLMKTRDELVPRVRDRLLELHPYEVPEVIALRANEVAEAYGRWVRDETIEVNG